MDTTPMPRAALIKLVNLLKPALSTQDYIPALKHIRFDGNYATAFNDVSAIAIKASIGIERCIPGELFGKALAAQAGEAVGMALDPKSGALLLTSGRSKLKVPTLSLAAHPFEMPKSEDGLLLDDLMLDAIKSCLVSVGTDANHPKAMGVTMQPDIDGTAVFYSTDGPTLSRATPPTLADMNGAGAVILPTFFCKQVLALAAANPSADVALSFPVGALLVEFVDNDAIVAAVFTRTIVDLQPLDFTKVCGKLMRGVKAHDMQPIPDDFEPALQRAMLVLAGEKQPNTLVSADGSGFTLSSVSSSGSAEDDLQASMREAGVVDKMQFKVDPALMLRGSKPCSRFAFLPAAVMFSNESGTFTTFVSHIG